MLCVVRELSTSEFLGPGKRRHQERNKAPEEKGKGIPRMYTCAQAHKFGGANSCFLGLLLFMRMKA